ncbi:MAG: glycosyltransferase family 4 protein [Clostridia bacterium]|nr:glycosyltransferase family 4 protein [Clostridia bacterium]
MKKVLLIETLSEINGGQKMSLLVSDMLRKTGDFDVVWAIPETGALSRELEDKGYKYYLFGNASLPAGVKGKSVIFKYFAMSARAICKINRIIKKEKTDIIYAPGPASLPWSAVCGTLKSKRVIWHLHHNFEDGPTKKLINFCSSFGCVKMILAVANVVGDQITNPKGKPKVKTIYNPVDFEKYSSGNAANVKESFPFLKKDGNITIEHIGIIHPTKRQDFTVRLVASMNKQYGNVHAVFIGSSSSEPEYSEELRLLAEKLGVQNNIHFAGRQNNVWDWLKAADAVIIPSNEGMSLAALEAMSAGCMIIATSTLGMGEMLKASKSGCVFDETTQNIDTISANILKEFGNKEEYVANGIKFAHENNLENYMGKITECFESINQEQK